MKKVFSLILAMVMAMTALTGIALAEAPETTDKEIDLSELVGLLEGLSLKEGEEDGEEADLSAFLGLLGLLGEEKETEEETKEETKEETEEDKSAELSGLLGLIGGLYGSQEEAAAEDEEADVSAFLGLLGGLFSGEKEPAEKSAVEAEEEKFDLAALLGMLSGLFGAEEEAAEEYPKAESVEQFYGTWNLVKVTFFGEEIPTNDGEEPLTGALIINEKGIYHDKVDDTETELVLKDGVLAFGEGEKDFVIIHLTETGICLHVFGILDLDYVAAE